MTKSRVLVEGIDTETELISYDDLEAGDWTLYGNKLIFVTDDGLFDVAGDGVDYEEETIYEIVDVVITVKKRV